MWAFYLLLLAVAAGFPDRVLDLLLALGSQILAKTSPMENREPTPEVAFDPVLSLLNVSPAHHTCVHRVSPFTPACRRPGRACFLSPRTIFGAQPSHPNPDGCAEFGSAGCAACKRDRAKRPAGLARLQWSDGAPHQEPRSGNGRRSCAVRRSVFAAPSIAERR